MNKYLETLTGIGRTGAVVAGAGIGAAKVIDSLSAVAEKPREQQNRFGWFAVGTLVLTGGVIGGLMYCKKKAEADKICREIRAKAEADVLLMEAQARYKNRIASSTTAISQDGDENGTHEIDSPTEKRVSWFEYYHDKFPTVLLDLPPIILDFMAGCPEGYEEAMLAQLTATLGAICCSRVQAKSLDGFYKRPNLQVIIEAPSGTGKGLFNHLYKAMLERRIKIDSENLVDFNDKKPILQTVGMAASSSMFTDILAYNKGVHCMAFEPEIKTVIESMKAQNGISQDLLCKAFDNDTVIRMNKDKTAPQGTFQVCLNYVLTGTPDAVENFISRNGGIPGGNAARICWCVLPPVGKEIPKLVLPGDTSMKRIHNLIDQLAEKYSYSVDVDGHFVPAPMTTVDLSYVNEVLKKWLDNQYDLAIVEGNKEREVQRKRFATIAFQCAIVYHVLYGCPTKKADRDAVVDLTLYVANYFMERYLHKFGFIQNQTHAKFEANELVSVARVMTKQQSLAPVDPFGGRDRAEIWYEEYMRNISYSDIAAQYNVTKDVVSSAVRRYREANNLPCRDEK